MSARNCRAPTAVKLRPACFCFQHVSSPANRVASSVSTPVCRFSPRISAPSAFLLLRNRLSSAVQPRCRFAIAPFSRLFFLIGRRERLCSAKNLCLPACAPRRYRARGATVFGFSPARFRLVAPFFLLTSAVFSRSDAEFSCRCAGFFVRRGCASFALMQVFATSCGALGASRSTFAV